MNTGALAARYAQALFAAAEARGLSAEIGGELSALGRELRENQAFRDFVLDKSLPAPRKKEIFSALLKDALHEYVYNFFCLLFDKDREPALERIIAAYQRLEQERQGQLPVTLTTARPLGEAEEAALAAALSRAYGREIVFSRCVDPAVLGGAMVAVGDVTIDGTLKSRLNALRKQLLKPGGSGAINTDANG